MDPYMKYYSNLVKQNSILLFKLDIVLVLSLILILEIMPFAFAAQPITDRIEIDDDDTCGCCSR